jgi:hypothetical protein
LGFPKYPSFFETIATPNSVPFEKASFKARAASSSVNPVAAPDPFITPDAFFCKSFKPCAEMEEPRANAIRRKTKRFIKQGVKGEFNVLKGTGKAGFNNLLLLKVRFK